MNLYSSLAGWELICFFAISGFVITVQIHSLATRYDVKRAIIEFFIRRCTRILPLYIAALTALYVASQIILITDWMPATLGANPDIELADSL